MTHMNGQPDLSNVQCAVTGNQVVYVFKPQEDITTAELAASTQLLFVGLTVNMGAPPIISDEFYNRLDEKTRRHWAIHQPPQQKPHVVRPVHNRLQLPPGTFGR